MKHLAKVLVVASLAVCLVACDDDENNSSSSSSFNVQVGPRPFFLVDDLPTGPLKTELEACKEKPLRKSDFSIGHRGAAMQFPEHTKESYIAAARMGAGILECDVTFTKDKELVCRHSQCDLHTTTNILATPLASKCTEGFTPSDGTNSASAKCCTSDVTLAEFRTLKGKMDAGNSKATSVEEYMNATASWRTDLYASSGTLMTHAESIALFKSLDAKMTPELKSPSVDMPFDGFSQQAYARKMIDEYKQAGVPTSDVFPQSFNVDDVKQWIAEDPDFGTQSVFLDDRVYADDTFEATQADMDQLFADGVRYIAPPMWALITLDGNDQLAESDYTRFAKNAGLKIITWTLERSGPLGSGGGWYYNSVTDATNRDSFMLDVMDFLAQDVGVEGIFSDWPGTVTYYASCKGL
ncbi:putative glycerophosphodiester phosphodiesterase 1 [BD1-7 clade bacterium]|uniref:glycerophosphodiester phosphodiesterase n=1 Tax=BD1-7 clade bacterium TaxID=2029982 RepID=A0A5S9MY29_9GAMM|nr:putative glycerophosphodiester phosphodiesterase 1 [BD1-7 clade bacterium]CAA0082464.1 putative glycerophosphodiester phosphodiesterase 1 [BD1-7 clade bacterium]